MTKQNNAEPLNQVVDHMVEETDGEKVSLGELLDVLDEQSYGPLLLIPGLLALFPPIGGIPGMSIFTGSLLILIAVQMPFAEHPWVPQRLQKISFSRKKLVQFRDQFKRWTRWLQFLLRPRLTFLSKPPFLYLIALCCIVLALSFYPLALVPFGVAAPAAAVTLFGLGLTVRDGLCLLLGFALMGLAGWLIFFFWPF